MWLRMKKLLMLLLILCFVFAYVGYARAIERMTGTMFSISEGVATIEWDAVSAAIGYEVRLVTLFHTPVTEYPPVEVNDGTSIVVTSPSAGFYLVQVNAWNWLNENTQEKQYSEWSSSTDPTVATVDGQPMAWWIYFKLAPPTDPVISKLKGLDNGRSYQEVFRLESQREPGCGEVCRVCIGTRRQRYLG